MTKADKNVYEEGRLGAYFWVYIMTPCLAGLLAGLLARFHFKQLLEQTIVVHEEDQVLESNDKNKSQEESLFKE